MRNTSSWKPTKYVDRAGKIRASRDPRMVSPGSRHYVDLNARHLQRAILAHARGELLDLGCGAVPLYGTYASLVDGVTCADWGNSLHGTGHLDVECDLNQPLPFPDRAFDTVILSDVLEHIAIPDQLVGEIRRILRPNGNLIVSVPFFYWVHEAPHDHFRYTRFALQAMAGRAGLDVVEVTAMGGSLDIFCDFTAKHLVRLPYVGRPLASMVQGVAAAWGETRYGASFRERSAAMFPMGYLMVARRPSQTTSK